MRFFRSALLIGLLSAVTPAVLAQAADQPAASEVMASEVTASKAIEDADSQTAGEDSAASSEASLGASAPDQFPLEDTAGALSDETAASSGELPSLSQQLPHDLSPWGMFMAADWVVKAVMIGLAIASLVTWTIWLVKSIELTQARRSAAAGLEVLSESRSLSEALLKLANEQSTTAVLARAAHTELEMSADAHNRDGIKERVDSHMARILAAAGRQIIRGTGPLATIGSTAPFVGLFGTVWGIMNSFIGISQAQTTNLAVVAPGIAEALLATAIGLVAAIPAVIIYNQFSRATASYKGMLGDAAAAVERLVSRDLDRNDNPSKAKRLKAID